MIPFKASNPQGCSHDWWLKSELPASFRRNKGKWGQTGANYGEVPWLLAYGQWPETLLGQQTGDHSTLCCSPSTKALGSLLKRHSLRIHPKPCDLGAGSAQSGASFSNSRTGVVSNSSILVASNLWCWLLTCQMKSMSSMGVTAPRECALFPVLGPQHPGLIYPQMPFLSFSDLRVMFNILPWALFI